MEGSGHHRGAVGHASVLYREDLRHDRRLGPSCIYHGGIVLKRSWAGEVRKVSPLVAISVNGGVVGSFSTSARSQDELERLPKLRNGRGLNIVRLMISDTCIGLSKAPWSSSS